MKKLIILSLLMAQQAFAANSGLIQPPNLNDLFPFPSGNPDLFPVEEDPGADAEIIIQDIHSKSVEVDGSELSFKWTELGYGAMTYKVIIPSLAKHSLFNHRNRGEEGPCLRSYRAFGSPGDINDPVDSIVVDIKVSNKYRINREKKICKVSVVEQVTTIIGDDTFDHKYEKDMGFRYIGDCLLD